jgi:sulfoxide reductase heme-binding subunit YedZ
MTALPPLAVGSLDWYITRGSGAVALLLLTLSLVLGVLDVRRLQSPRWPRFVIDTLHRNAALLALVFLALHILTTVLDRFVSIPLIDAFVPFIGSYRTFWLGLGAVACDLMLAVILTSLLRQRLGYNSWRAAHWLVYACWPIAVLHGFGTGSDAGKAWLLTINIACIATVLAAVVVRLLPARPARGDSGGAAVRVGVR